MKAEDRETQNGRLRGLLTQLIEPVGDLHWDQRILDELANVWDLDLDGADCADGRVVLRRLLQKFGAEVRQIANRVALGKATLDETLHYITSELREALDSLEPEAPSNGRVNDGWHASACVLRAWATLTSERFQKLLAAGRAASASPDLRCEECAHVFPAAAVAREDRSAWGHPCFGEGPKIHKGRTPCESYRAPITAAPAPERDK